METVSRPQAAPANASLRPPPQREDSVVRDMSRLMLLVETDAERIATRIAHLVESRRYPRDCLRNGELLEDSATRLLTHARQIVRRALENQP